MINKLLILATFLTASYAFTTNNLENISASKESSPEITVEETLTFSEEDEIDRVYESFLALNDAMPAKDVFANGMKGYNKLKEDGKIKNEILTIVDFGKASTKKRMWILDMKSQKVLFNTYVAHGKNTGGNKALKFSNTPNSLQSSLGFYVTAETYYGKNGLSLFIDGMEKGFNSKARERYVVIHGADYATESFIERNGRLGRSYGCPAVPQEISKEIIDLIKGQSALFIYHPNQKYLQNSEYLNEPAV